MSLSQVDITQLLAERGRREPNHVATNDALATLAQVLADAPDQVAQALVESALKLTGAQSAGLSLEDRSQDPWVFRWVATAGEFQRYVNEALPRDFSPCGVVLERDRPVLMREPVEVFPYIAQMHAPVREVMLVPFHRGGIAIGTLWVVSHDDSKEFDAEDLRILKGLTRFAAAAVQTVELLAKLRLANEVQREALITTEHHLKNLQDWFEQSPGFLVFLRGADYRVELVNQAYCELVSKERQELLGRPLFETLSGLKGQGFEQLLDGVRLTGIPHHGRGVPVIFDVGKAALRVTKYVDFVYQPLIEQGRVQGILVQGHECTDRVMAIEQLREEDKRKDGFLAALVHEMRSPLSAMTLSIHVLKTSADDELSRPIGVLERQTCQLAALVDDMTDVAAIRSGKFQLRRSKVLVKDVVSHAVEASAAFVAAKRHALTVTLPNEDIFVLADAMRLSQVLVNLINNAAKYTPESGRITLAVQGTTERVLVTVSDTGVGIKPEFLPHVFDMFVQVPMGDRPNRSGMGIGLAIVRQFVELHDGDVHVTSGGVGEGSTFTVDLPRTL